MALTLISSATASNSLYLSFTSGIDSTYDAYEFHFINMHPSVDNAYFGFQCNASGQTGFNEVITSATYNAYNNEAGTISGLAYNAGTDQAQGTSYQYISHAVGNVSDESVSGILTLYNPASTTFTTLFRSDSNTYTGDNSSIRLFASGYINTTAAIDELNFQFSTGNIDSGTIHLYGVN